MSQRPEYPTQFADEVTYLSHIPQAHLNEQGLYVVKGLTRDLASQLSLRSQEPAVMEYCFNDYVKKDKYGNIKLDANREPVKGRFFDLETTEAWQKKQRQPYMLVRPLGHEALEANGIVWLGPEAPGKDEPEIDGAEITFALRLYGDAVGKRNSDPFTRVALEAHGEEYGNNGVWLEAWGDNEAAIRPYRRNHFDEVARVPGMRHGKEVDRVYMLRNNQVDSES